jgi:hypothetical protein
MPPTILHEGGDGLISVSFPPPPNSLSSCTIVSFQMAARLSRRFLGLRDHRIVILWPKSRLLRRLMRNCAGYLIGLMFEYESVMSPKTC